MKTSWRRCLLRRHDLIVVPGDGEAVIVCRRCRGERLVPMAGEPARESLAARLVLPPGASLVDSDALAALQLAPQVERAFAQVDEPW